MTRVLMLSTDRKILEEGSDARERMALYGTVFDELRILLMCKDVKKGEQKLSSNVFVYLVPMDNMLQEAWKVFKGIPIEMFNGLVDIVTAQDPFELGYIGAKIAKKLGVPLQLQLHTDFLSPYFANPRTNFRNFLKKQVARRYLARANCIRVVSKRIKDSLERELHIPEEKITILPIFVDIKKIGGMPVTISLREKYPQFNFIILMASRLTKEKNISLALRSFKEIVTKHPKTGLCIVGEGPMKKNYESRIRDYGLENNVVFENWVPYDTLISYYKTADLFLLTSNYEGYGRTLIEAAASGCPIVTTNVGAVGDILKAERDVLACS